MIFIGGFNPDALSVVVGVEVRRATYFIFPIGSANYKFIAVEFEW